jgi:AraC-like DNA-binding protein
VIQRGLVRTVGARFHLGGLGAFGTTALRPHTNLTPPPEDVFGPEVQELQRTLEQTTDPDASARALDAFFVRRMDCSGAYPLFERALAALGESHGCASVETIAEAAGTSSRQVDRLFARYLGIPPKTVGRVLRFQKALRRLMRDPGCALVHIATDAGYHDQAHFIKEFKKMSGGVPRGYRGYYPPAGPNDFAPNVVVFVQDRERTGR